ncbi:MAG: hypothetical protein K6G33_00760 [Ruminococcus sp.]|uniref:hypothetical protein n=1 Tax=Ruminococcus sp. TaxID=41978 RepID=UPI0025EAD5FE|nr:hypothetical protein [Ruminococcus sp.]MCR5599264.1 hypothetical protein [Ruminococcus sp.]
MINYIIFGAIVMICFASIITVAAEPFVQRNTKADRVLRAVRIRLREISLTGFCVTAAVLLIFGLVFDENMGDIFVALGVLLLTLIVLHPEDFISMFRTRRKAKKAARLGLTPKLAGEVPLTKLAKELEPIEVESTAVEGKE